jgi:hypothetical protein
LQTCAVLETVHAAVGGTMNYLISRSTGLLFPLLTISN